MDKLSIDNLFSTKSLSKNKLDVNSLINNKPEIKINKSRHFTSNELIQTRNERRKKVLEYYIKYYDSCFEKIELLDKQGKTDLIFEVPVRIPDCPNYIAMNCIDYVEKKLREQYMDTSILNDNSIFVTWKYIEINKSN
jgi:hypothetical protein